MHIPKNKLIELIFRASSALLLLLAAYLIWEGDYERAFIVAAVGSISFFIGTRFQVKERLQMRASEREAPELESPAVFERETSDTEHKNR